MLDDKKMYPITILRKLDRDSQSKLSKARLMLCKDLLSTDIDGLRRLTGISKKRLSELREEANSIVRNS